VKWGLDKIFPIFARECSRLSFFAICSYRVVEIRLIRGLKTWNSSNERSACRSDSDRGAHETFLSLGALSAQGQLFRSRGASQIHCNWPVTRPNSIQENSK
jgi:hypothetical protein